MPQNRSSAVMAQRREAPNSLDFFPTPPWATRALLEIINRPPNETAWDPCCGEGHMVRPLKEQFRIVRATDVHDYDAPEQDALCDFLIEWDWPTVIQVQGIDWIIMNPPFRLSVDFILTAIRTARVGVAALVRTGWLDGGVAENDSRYERLFRPHPPTEIWQFCDRVSMFKGRLVHPSEGTTATSYLWAIWYMDGRPRKPLQWIPPCRKRLEKAGDYLDNGDRSCHPKLL